MSERVVGEMLVRKWLEHDLTVGDIVDYMRDSAIMEEDEWTDEEVKHVANICYSVYAYLEHGRPAGHFVKYFTDNDLMNATGRADGTLNRAMKYLVRFMYNGAPNYAYEAIVLDGDAREKVKKRREGEEDGKHRRYSE